jgi:phytoene synthase
MAAVEEARQDGAAAAGGPIAGEVRARAREGAIDHYLAALLAPRDVRDDLIAVAALVAELARIPATVREAMMGEIRLQWWRDALPALQRGDPTGHPVADRFGVAMRRHGLPASLVVGMTEARAFDLYPDPMPDETALMGYITKTQGAAFALAARVLGAEDRGAAGAAIAAAAQAYGRARVLAGLPEALAAGRVPLPGDMLRRHAADPRDFVARPASPSVRAVLADARDDCQRHVQRAQQTYAEIPVVVRGAVLPAALIGPYLQAFDREAARGLESPIEIAPLRRVWCLWRAHRTGRL